MATPIAMPRQGQSVESCVISQWLKSKGDQVREGETLFTFETDKASFEFPSPISGTLLDVFAPEGEDVPVLATVGVIGSPGEDASLFRVLPAAEKSGTPEMGKRGSEPAQTITEVHASSPGTDQTMGISPRARKLAMQESVDVSALHGTGPQGRIIERDVKFALESAPMTKTARAMASAASLTLPSAGTGIGGRICAQDLVSSPPAPSERRAQIQDEVTEVKLTTIRRIIADRMVQSLREAAQLTMDISADATELLAFRAKVKAGGAALGLENITINDLVAFVAARVLARTPEINATFTGDKILQYRHTHLAVAMDTPKGLMVPVVRFADLLSLNDLARTLKELASQCQQGSINPDLLSGGTFTVSNLGAFGIESFTPVLNPPQVALLGVNTITPKPVAGKNGEYTIAPHLGLSLTIDHRAVDGGPAARFLKACKGAIENFSLTLSI